MRRALTLLLLASCAPKRAPELVHPVDAPPISTRFTVPDAGPFDFSKPPADSCSKATSDLGHAGELMGYPVFSPLSP
jgi:hypothetical protein